MKKYPLLQSQLGVFLECQSYPDNTQYNLPFHVALDRQEDAEALAGAWKKLIRASAVLRARFMIDPDGNPLQWPDDEMPVEVPIRHMREAEAEDYIRTGFVRPFDVLGGEPLFRVELIETEEKLHMLLDFHHLIMDGLSYSSLIERGFSSFLDGKEKPVDNSFFEIAEEEAEYFQSEEYQENRAYFVNALKNAESASLSSLTSATGQLVTHMEALDRRACDAWCAEHHVDGQALFQAAFALALGRLTRSRTPVYCTSYHARVNRKMMRSQGMFVNNVALKTDLTPDGTVLDLIRAVEKNTASVYAMGRYPFTHLNRELGIVPGVSFNFRPFKQYLKINGKKYPAAEIPRDLVQMDLNVHIEDIEGDYAVCAESSDAVNSAETVAMFAKAVRAAVLNMMAQPAAPVRDISLVDPNEAARLLEISAGERKPYDASKTWLDHFKAQTAQHPDACAVVDENGAYSYGQLDRLSDSVAAWLIGQKVQPNDFVALKTSRTKDFMAGVLGVWKAGAAYVPIDQDYPADRISFILSDSGAKLMLEDENIRAAEQTACSAPPRMTAPESYAYMIYTSGSTGRPKGVVIPQSAMLNLVTFIRNRWGHTEKSRIACHSNFAFDASVEDLYPVLMAGGALYIVPESVRRDILLMRAYIRENGITGGCYTTQFGQLLGDEEDPLKLDYIVLGGEKMTTVPYITGKVYNTYGPTEFTVDATYCEVARDQQGDIPIGRALDNCEAFILDSFGNLLPQGAVGELCLAGPQVAVGYWKLPDKTKDVFQTVLFPDGVRRRIYRTGDLARYNGDNELEYLGRVDFQVKLHGFRIELGEIDTRAMAFEGIRQAVSQVKQERIVLYYVADQEISEDALRDFLSESLASYMVPSVFMPLEKMPLTANGKVDLKALPEPVVEKAEITAPETELEAVVLRIVKKVLGFADIGTTTNLVSAGMSSLDTMRLNAGLSKELGSSFKVSEILKDPTVRGIAALEEHYIGEQTQLKHYRNQAAYPMTENQRGVYLDWEMNSETTQYNLPGVYLFENVAPEALARSLTKVLNAHSYLKTRFVKADGDVVQKPNAGEEAVISVEVLDAEPDTAFFQQLVKPFDLLADRLYRAAIYSYQNRTWLFLDIHHIICDGLSAGVLMNDLAAVMNGGKPTKERVTAYDYALYEKEFLAGSSFKLAEEYFENLIREAQPVSYPDSETPDGSPKGIVEYAVARDAIDAFCKAREVTPGSFLQAAFALVLQRLTREDKPLYLTVSSGRTDTQLSDTIGMFVRTLPAVYAGSGDASETAAAYAKATYEQLQEIYAREIVPYTWLVEKYRLRAEIMFAYQGGISDEVEGAKTIPLNLNTAKFPVMLTVFPEGGNYKFLVEYDGTRYSQADMLMLARAAGTASLGLAQAETVNGVILADEAEAEELARLGRGEDMERDEEETILTLLKRRVAATPDAPAVVFHDKTLTYREVDDITSRLAVYLRNTCQIGPEDNVGVLIARSELMMLYPFAVIKTGAGYMPLDPHFPTERLSFMCEDASVRLILSEDNLIEEKLPDFTGARFYSSQLSSLPDVTEKEIAALPEAKAHNRFVTIFTSGTTGKPKAVELEHYGIVNYCYWYVKEFGLTMSDRVAGYANFGFDAHMIDLYPSVMAGSAVYIFDEALRMDITAMNAYMEENAISVAFMTTQIGCLISEINHSLRYLSTGGEKMPPVTPPAFRFLNVYGPTECSLFSTYYDVPGYFEGKLIGRPLSNYQLYIIDQAGRLLPRGARGELLIAGQGVARGYMNRPELTAEKFIDFKPTPDSRPVKAYRSGDLVRWSEDGNVEYLGRIDKQVKLRGLRIELGEIENRVLSYPGIGQAVVEVKGKTNPQLCCYYTAETSIDIDALKQYLGETLTEFMVPEVYMRLDALPLNPNGKVDRKALPEPEFAAEEIVAPETEEEKRVFEAAAEILGTEAFGVTSNLISQGMSSIAAMRLAAVLESRLGLRVRVADILKQPTVRGILEGGKAPAGATSWEGRLRHYPEREYYPITENQRGLFIDWEMNHNSTQYNIPNVYLFQDISAQRLAEAVRTAVNLHGYLKTRMVQRDGDVMQQPHPEEAVDVPVTALTEAPDAEFFQKLVVPFDLLNDKLYRFHIFTYEQQTYLFMDIHHIIYDGLSSAVFMADLTAACKGTAGTAETITAYDYAVYEQAFFGSEAFSEIEAYFDGLIDGVTLAGYPDSATPDLTADAADSEEKVGTLIRKVEAAPIDAFCRRNAVTAGNYLQAAFAEVLQSLTREEKPMYVTISNGRSADIALQSTVGMYVRTLPAVFAGGNAKTHGDESVVGYVQAVQKQLQMTCEREIYPYTKIVERHRLRADIMMTWQGGMTEDGIGEGEDSSAAQSIPLKLNGAKLPILITTYPEEGSYVLMLEYDRTRYSVKDMDTLLSCVANAASSMAHAERIRDISFLSEAEHEATMALCAGEKLDFDRTKTWLSMFAHWVQVQPDHTAVTDSLGELTYAELDKASDKMAAWLMAHGIMPNDFVIIKMHRFKEFAVAVLGIHKAGACYVPVDPNYPRERIEYMEKDSEAKVVLTEELIAEILRNTDDPGHIDVARPENYAYMIYTSGSTGRPKGAIIPQGSLMNYVQVYTRKFEVTPEDRVSHHITFSFDSHIRDFYPALAAGASLHFMPDEITKEPDLIYEFLEKNRITGSAYATAMGLLMINGYNLKQRFISVGGEALIGVRSDHARVFNVCGATEVTDVVVDYELEKGKYYESVPIGRAMANTWAFIVDRNGHLLPQGVPGEICYAGLNIGAGYWKMPEKTKDAFVDCPFIPGERMYHTGDLGRYDETGNVEYLGRLDFQVKLRGFRIELGEIESRAVQYPGMKQVVAAVRKDILVLYYTADTAIDQDQLRDHLAKSLTAYMVPGSFMQLDRLPMTPSGKIDRKALPDPKQTSSVTYTAPETEEEKTVAESMQKVLGLSNPVGALDNFFELGGDSIKAIRMVSLIRQAGYRAQVSDIMNQKTVRLIASVIQREEGAAAISQQPMEGIVPHAAITRYYQYLELPEPQYYDQATLWRLREPCGKERVQEAIDALTQQHDMLRAIYRDGSLFVRPADARIAVQEAEAGSKDEITRLCEELQASIRMDESLVNVSLIRLGEDEYLFMAAHHLIIDGVSWRVIASDLESALTSLKKGEKISLPMKTHTYRDYANALQKYRDSYRLAQEIPYWENAQKELLLLPGSCERDYGRKILLASATMDEASTRAFTKANFGMMNADINDAMLTAVSMSYAAMTGESSVSVQLEGHGREDVGEPLVTDRTVGWFTSIYPVVLKNIGGSLQNTFVEVKESLHRVPGKGVGYNVLRFLDGARPFPSCGDRVARIGFNYLGEMDSEQASEDGVLATADIPTGASISPRNCFGNDLSINALVENGKFSLYVTYNAGLYDQAQMDRFTSDVLKNMAAVAEYLSSLTEKQFTATDLGEPEWTAREFRTVTDDFASRGEKISRIYPLTPMQEGMLFKYLTDPQSWAYKIVSIFELDVLPTEEQLTSALDRLAAKHEVLRTAIIYDGVKKPRQAIVERRLLPEMVDLTGKADPKRAVENLRINILNDAFEMQRKPLFQMTCAKKDGNNCYLILAIHHAIMDGWCMGIYTGDLFAFLNEEITGIRTPDATPENGLYEKAVREILSKDKAKGLSYWKELLADYETKAEIPSFGDVPLNEQSKSDSVLTTVDQRVTEQFLALCSSEGATVSNGIELAWGLVLQTYCRTEDVVFAKVVSGRDNTGIDVSNLVGLFINSVPVRVKAGQDTTARQLLRALQAQAAESNKYDFCPLIEIQQQTDLGADLFQNIIAFENYDSGLEGGGESELSFTVQPVVLKEENFDEVTPTMYIDGEGRLCLNLTFNRRHYRREEIETVGRLFAVLVEELVKKPDVPVVNLSRVGEAELPAVIALSKGEELPYDISQTWLDLFAAQVKRNPSAMAVADESSSMTFAELDHASDQVACWLISHGVKEFDFVAVKMSRVKEFAAAFIGVQKAGAAYIPIDPAYPPERIAFMETDAGAKVTLTDEMMPEILAVEAEHVNRAGPDHFAYMIYTSGSTGTPKGAVLYHKGLLNFTQSLIKAYSYTAEDRISSHRSFSFDAHICDFYAPLSAGGSVHIMPESIRKDPNRIFDFLEEHRITGGGYTTALAKILKNGYPLKQRFISCGGEALQGVVSDDVLIYNEYGPTECTCNASMFILERGVSYEALPIGRPMPNCYCFLVDKYNNLVPPGVRGEICIAGRNVGYGYWNQPEKTDAVFGNCPFVEGSRMYHTGDLGYYNKEGQLMYAGRIDFQVKLHGFRIELGEIENCASQYSGIKLVNAQVKKDALVLYYSADTRIDPDALKAFMAETLTEYMVPTVYIQLDQMPMTPNGKIDRKALPEPDISSGLQNVPPENRLEENCLRIAREILPGIEFGVTDDLFAAGLNSLNAMLLTSRISTELRVKLRVSDIMRYKTIRGFIQGKRRISWLYEEYDGNKPTVVFVQGIVLIQDTEHLHKLLNEVFNVVIIEPIQNHYDKLFQGEHFDEVTAFYLTSAQLLLPEDARVTAFMGFSFGGELAFGMADGWKKLTGKSAAVVMGDSTLPKSGDHTDELTLTSAQELKKLVETFEHKEHDYTQEELQTLADLNNMVGVICSENSLAPYDGRVIFLNAHKNSTDEMMRVKMDALRYYAPQAEIHDFPDYSHSGIFSSEQLHPFYRELIKKLIQDTSSK